MSHKLPKPNSRDMKMYLAFATALLCSCTVTMEDNGPEKQKEAILAAEKSFAKMASEEGIPEAFIAFADQNAALLRQGKVLKGKTAIAAFYNAGSFDNVTLEWEPTFVDISESGDLAYTYGDYVFTRTDSLGNISKNTGVFHTVWKKQADGTWKYVWD